MVRNRDFKHFRRIWSRTVTNEAEPTVGTRRRAPLSHPHIAPRDHGEDLPTSRIDSQAAQGTLCVRAVSERLSLCVNECGCRVCPCVSHHLCQHRYRLPRTTPRDRNDMGSFLHVCEWCLVPKILFLGPR